MIAYNERQHIPGLIFEKPAQFICDKQGLLYQKLLTSVQFGVRALLEEDTSKKQLIPYVVLYDRCEGFLTLERKKAQSEQRLHGLLSLGVGGHLEKTDMGSHKNEDLIYTGMMRELYEELTFKNPQKSEPLYRGLLNDDRNPVGRVHLGVIFSYEVCAQDIQIAEISKMSGKWLTSDKLQASKNRLETWSALLLPHLSEFF